MYQILAGLPALPGTFDDPGRPGRYGRCGVCPVRAGATAQAMSSRLPHFPDGVEGCADGSAQILTNSFMKIAANYIQKLSCFDTNNESNYLFYSLKIHVNKQLLWSKSHQILKAT